MRLNSCLSELTEYFATQSGDQWDSVRSLLPKVVAALQRVCKSEFHADLLESGAQKAFRSHRPPRLDFASAGVADAGASRGIVSNCLPSAVHPSSVSSSRGKSSTRKFFGTDLSQTRSHGSVMTADQIRQRSLHSLAAHTLFLKESANASASSCRYDLCGLGSKDLMRSKIVTALFSLLLKEEEFQEKKFDQAHQLSKRNRPFRSSTAATLDYPSIPVKLHTTVDLQTLRSLNQLCFREITSDFLSSYPCWAAALLIALLFLHRSVAEKFENRNLIHKLWSAEEETPGLQRLPVADPVSEQNIPIHDHGHSRDALGINCVPLPHELLCFLTELEMDKYMFLENVTSTRTEKMRNERFFPAEKIRRRSSLLDIIETESSLNCPGMSDWKPAVLAVSKQLSYINLLKRQHRTFPIFVPADFVMVGTHEIVEGKRNTRDTIIEQDGIEWVATQLAEFLPSSMRSIFA